MKGGEKKVVQLLKNGKRLFYIQKVNCVLRQEGFGRFLVGWGFFKGRQSRAFIVSRILAERE